MCPQCRDSSVREWEGDERENKREEERHQYRNTDIYRGSEGDEGESTREAQRAVEQKTPGVLEGKNTEATQRTTRGDK